MYGPAHAEAARGVDRIEEILLNRPELHP